MDLFETWKRRGAIAPSSQFLARAITAHIESSDTVVEFGAGAGAITREIVQEVPGRRLHVVEKATDHASALRRYTPNVHVADALEFLASPPCDLEGCKAISGLPLLNFRRSFRETLLTGLLLEAGAASVRHFTYTPSKLFSPDWLDAHGLRAQRVAFVLRNLPPAFVWEYTRPVGRSRQAPLRSYTDRLAEPSSCAAA